MNGVRVTATGNDDSACGSAAAPCRSIAFALAQATAQGEKTVYVGAGNFDGGFSIDTPVRLSGGWDTSWSRDCAQPSSTVIQMPDNASIGVSISTLGSVEVEYVSVLGKAPAAVAAQESVYGFFITGASTEVKLTGVKVELPDAGDGASGSPGGTTANATGTCTPPGNGANGMAGDNGLAAPGSFSETGYAPGDGNDGELGEMGSNGTRTLAMAGTAQSYACQSPCGSPSNVTLQKGTDGRAGCGGDGGAKATAGSGGGSSIAIYVWGAKVTLFGGMVRAGDGGDGGDGAKGGLGGNGSAGIDGNPGPTVTIEPSCCGTPTNVRAPGGTATAGGRGGAGGDSSGGAGGHSYGVYVGGGGSALATDTVLQAGIAGDGGGGPVPGPNGKAAATEQ